MNYKPQLESVVHGRPMNVVDLSFALGPGAIMAIICWSIFVGGRLKRDNYPRA